MGSHGRRWPCAKLVHGRGRDIRDLQLWTRHARRALGKGPRPRLKETWRLRWLPASPMASTVSIHRLTWTNVSLAGHVPMSKTAKLTSVIIAPPAITAAPTNIGKSEAEVGRFLAELVPKRATATPASISSIPNRSMREPRRQSVEDKGRQNWVRSSTVLEPHECVSVSWQNSMHRTPTSFV
jgi:hypothetical protein